MGQVVRDLGCETYYDLIRKTEKREEWRNATNLP